MTDTIAQLSSELASSQAKLILLLLDNQRLLKRLSDKGGSWNTSRGVTDGKTSGVVRPDHGMVRASTNVTTTGTSFSTPVSSVLSPILGTSIIQQKRTPEAVVIKNTRRSDNIRRLIIAKF